MDNSPAPLAAAVRGAAPGGVLPVVVDLDGTLIHGDTTLACLFSLGRRPLRLFGAIWGSRPDRAA